MPSKIFKITRYSCVVIRPNYKMMTVVIFIFVLIETFDEFCD